MIHRKFHFRVLFSLLALTVFHTVSANVFAQSNQKSTTQSQPRLNEVISADKGSVQDDAPPMTTFEEEMRAKRAIRLAEKEHQQNMDRAREISQLAKELEDSAKKTTVALNRETIKKVDRLEKLTKKIRGDAGGEDGEITIPDKPTDLAGTVVKISKVADSLSKNVQNTPRQVVSTSVIDNANVLLELIKFLRTLAPAN